MFSLELLNSDQEEYDRYANLDAGENSARSQSSILSSKSDLSEDGGSIVQDGCLTAPDGKERYSATPHETNEISSLDKLFDGSTRSRCNFLFYLGMHLSKLRLVGFKSFVETTEFLIQPGLTGVIGPNGCGKSNLVEALRWVMGENSYKSMRASGMDDVIRMGREFTHYEITPDASVTAHFADGGTATGSH